MTGVAVLVGVEVVEPTGPEQVVEAVEGPLGEVLAAERLDADGPDPGEEIEHRRGQEVSGGMAEHAETLKSARQDGLDPAVLHQFVKILRGAPASGVDADGGTAQLVRDLVVRVRTIGDIISTGMVVSPANTVDDIIAEIAAARVTERGSRADDKASEAAMEDRKKQGYF